MREQQIQKKIHDRLLERGAYVVTVITASKRGVPDIIGIYKGKGFGIEVKKPDKLHTVSAIQKYNLSKISEVGGFSRVMSSVDEVDDLLSTIDTLTEWC